MSRFSAFMTLILLLIGFPTESAASSSSLASRCLLCREMILGFDEGLSSSEGRSFGGGNTAWEEKHLGSYATSETRLTDILEHHLCAHSKGTGEKEVYKCNEMRNEVEEFIEQWWLDVYRAAYTRQRQSIAANVHSTNSNSVPPSPPNTKFNASLLLYEALCVDHLGTCCYINTFGPQCKSCDSLPAAARESAPKPDACFGHGQCDGAETRSGSGQCVCAEGFDGEYCDRCRETGFYRSQISGEAYSEANPSSELSDAQGTFQLFECNKCDQSCSSKCKGPLASDCLEGCKAGFNWNNELGCVDNDECSDTEGPAPCPSDSYCHNTVGSFTCEKCTSGCSKCIGTGLSRTACLECAPGFLFKDDQCTDLDECTESPSGPPCTKPNEECQNKPGSYSCECIEDFARNPDGECVDVLDLEPEEPAEAEEDPADSSEAEQSKPLRRTTTPLPTLDSPPNNGAAFLPSASGQVTQPKKPVAPPPRPRPPMNSNSRQPDPKSRPPPNAPRMPPRPGKKPDGKPGSKGPNLDDFDLGDDNPDELRKAMRDQMGKGKEKKQKRVLTATEQAKLKRLQIAYRYELLKCFFACVLFVCACVYVHYSNWGSPLDWFPRGKRADTPPPQTNGTESQGQAAGGEVTQPKPKSEPSPIKALLNALVAGRSLICQALAIGLIAFLYTQTLTMDDLVRIMRKDYEAY